jgi:Lipocalin-like domain
MTRRMAIAVLALALLTPVSASRSLAEEKDKLVGTWKLISAVSEDLATGQKTNIYKGTPVGFIAYGADGRVMTIIVDSDRKKPTGTVTTAP